jgi:hypothetical protein
VSQQPTTHTGLRQDLRAIQVEAEGVLRQERRQRISRPALAEACLLSAALAAVYLAYLGMAHLTGSGWPAASVPTLFLWILAPGLAWFLTRILHASARRISGAQALAAVDTRHDLQDRLQAAVEFLARTGRSGFMEAALLDAAGFAKTAMAKGLPREQAPVALSPRAYGFAGAALVLLALALWVPMPLATKVVDDNPPPVEVAQLDPEAATDREQPKDRPTTPRAPEESHEPASSQGQRRTARRGRKDSQLSSKVKKTRGVMGSGQSADAASASGTSEARGTPSSQAQASLAGKKPVKKKSKPKPRKSKKPVSEPTPARKPEDDSGATAGRGAASGSNKSPSASPWSSKDQVMSEDEEDLEDDEEVDDEFDMSDARGGVQPHLRDRRPPVNRDLGIGFGNQKNPDANGRGGPSELKKSRGVASLVLGVPIPDHVKGQPNPGKTKITQERVEPKAEDAAAVKAGPRQPRQSPVGHFQSPHLESWMRDLIRSYFQLIRPQGTEPKNPPKTPKNSGD